MVDPRKIRGLNKLGNRQYLKIAGEITRWQSELTPEQRKHLPPSRYPGSPARLMRSNREISREITGFLREAQRGRKGPYAREEVRDPVLGVILILMGYGFMVPTIWTDQPMYLRRYWHDGDVLYGTEGQVVYDAAAERARGIKHPIGCKNPEWGVKASPEIPRKFSPFPQLYRPTLQEKEARVMSFLQDYAETGHLMASAKANGSTYFQLLIWANEQPHLVEQIALAESAIRMGIRSNAQHMALEGDKQMISLMMRDEADRRKSEAIRGRKVDALDLHEETNAALEIAQRAAEHYEKAQASRLQLPNVNPEDIHADSSGTQESGDVSGGTSGLQGTERVDDDSPGDSVEPDGRAGEHHGPLPAV